MPVRGTLAKQDVPLTDPVQHIQEIKRFVYAVSLCFFPGLLHLLCFLCSDLRNIEDKLDNYNSLLLDLKTPDHEHPKPTPSRSETEDLKAVIRSLEERVIQLESAKVQDTKELSSAKKELLYTVKQLACGGNGSPCPRRASTNAIFSSCPLFAGGRSCWCCGP